MILFCQHFNFFLLRFNKQNQPFTCFYFVKAMTWRKFVVDKMGNLLKHINNFLRGNHHRNLEQLQWQRYLLHTGIPATAKVLDMVQEESKIHGYVLIHIWVMLKVRGNISYQHVQTLMNKKDIPSVGQIINIRYCPDDVSKVIIV